jgi:hypothetical protein
VTGFLPSATLSVACSMVSVVSAMVSTPYFQ